MRDILILVVHLIVTFIEARETGWHSISGGRVCPSKTSTVGFESLAETITQFTCIGSNHRRFVRTASASWTYDPLCNRAQAIDASSFPPRSGKTKVSSSVLVEAQAEARSEGSFEGTHRRNCRDETA